MPTLLDGKAAAHALCARIHAMITIRLVKGYAPPHLAILQIGDYGPSQVYVAQKIKACEEVGIQTTLIQHTHLTQAQAIQQLTQLNNDPNIDGIILQLPLPSPLPAHTLLTHIHPNKDVDGLHPLNQGKLTTGKPTFIPATPLGISLLLQHYNISLEGKHCVIIGRSRLVGRPLSILLSQQKPHHNATVTLCHSRTQNLTALTRTADLIVTATGKPSLIRAEHITPGTIVIDVGLSRVADGQHPKGSRLQGDVDFEQVAPLCSHITPVPGGVGPMTVAALLSNTLHAASKRFSKKITNLYWRPINLACL